MRPTTLAVLLAIVALPTSAVVQQYRRDGHPRRNAEQARQYALAAEASITLSRAFLDAGYDLVIPDALEPRAFERDWAKHLDGVNHEIVILMPSLDVALERSRQRRKRVQERHTRSQHEALKGWPSRMMVDTTSMEPRDVVEVLDARTGARRTSEGLVAKPRERFLGDCVKGLVSS